jgi:hypothetical protein
VVNGGCRDYMSERHHHWIEKLQVQLTMALALAAVYFLAWPLLRPQDPQGPLVLLASGRPAAVVGVAILAALLAVLVGVFTATSRPEGATAVLLVSIGGLSLRSPAFRNLIWYRQGEASQLFGLMIAELVLLAVVLLAALVLLGLVRSLMARLVPRWTWMRRAPGSADVADEPSRSLLGGALGVWGTAGTRQEWKQLAGCAVITLGAASVLVFLLLQSPDRGQIIFSLVAAFGLGALLGDQVFPSERGLALLALPVLMGIVFYVLAAQRPIAIEPQAWIMLENYSRPVPLDWITAGGGGAMTGLWISRRVRQAKKLQKEGQAQA